MNRLFAILFGFALFALGCGSEFVTGPETDAGVGGSAGTGGHAGNTGGGGGTAGGGNGGGGTGGHAGNTGGGGGTAGGGNGGGGGNPCPDATAPDLADLLGQPCASLFANCGPTDTVSRGQFIGALISVVPAAKLQGYVEPTIATFPDVPLGNPVFPAVEKSVWLELIPVTPFFNPEDLTNTCFAQDTFALMQALPSIYDVVSANQASGNLSGSLGPTLTTQTYVYGTSFSSHLTQMVRVVNNLSGDFTVPQPTKALEAIVIRCQFANGSPNYNSYTVSFDPLTWDGKAEFTNLDCYSDSSGTVELQLQMNPSALPQAVGQQARIGIDPGTLPVRGGQANAPTKTIN